jgi:hypothetical protein
VRASLDPRDSAIYLLLRIDSCLDADSVQEGPVLLRADGDGDHHRHELLPGVQVPLRPQRHGVRQAGQARPQRQAPPLGHHRHRVHQVGGVRAVEFRSAASESLVVVGRRQQHRFRRSRYSPSPRRTLHVRQSGAAAARRPLLLRCGTAPTNMLNFGY